MKNELIYRVVKSEMRNIRKYTKRNLELHLENINGCYLTDIDEGLTYLEVRRITSGGLELVFPITQLTNKTRYVSSLETLKEWLMSNFGGDDQQIQYSESRYHRGHNDITKEGILLRLGEAYLREDGDIYQVMSVGCIGDNNILIQNLRTRKFSTIHAGIIFENKFICDAGEVNELVKEREHELREQIKQELIGGGKNDASND